MSTNNSTAYRAGLGLTAMSVALFVVLAILKIKGLIVFSWWWVTAPVTLPLLLVTISVVAALIVLSNIEKDDFPFN